MVLFFPYVTDTADYTFKLSLIMPTAFINQNMQAEVVFCEKALSFYNTESRHDALGAVRWNSALLRGQVMCSWEPWIHFPRC